MLIILAFLLLFLLPTPWNLVGFLVVIPLWILELLAWNRSMKETVLFKLAQAAVKGVVAPADTSGARRTPKPRR